MSLSEAGPILSQLCLELLILLPRPPSPGHPVFHDREHQSGLVLTEVQARELRENELVLGDILGRVSALTAVGVVLLVLGEVVL